MASKVKIRVGLWVTPHLTKPQTRGDTFFHLSKLNWFGKLYIKVTRQTGRPNCLDGHQAVGRASLARSSQDLKQSTIMINHPGGFQARAKHCVCAHSSCIAPVSLQNLLKKHMEEQGSHKTQRLRRQQLRNNSKPTKKNPKSRRILNSLKTVHLYK